MTKTRAWLLCLMTRMVVDAGPAEIPGDPSSFRLLGKPYSTGSHGPRTQWPYRPQEDFHRHQSQGSSHGYASHPYGSALGATETSSEHPSFSSSSQEYWRPSYAANSNFTGGSYYGYRGNHVGPTVVADDASYQESTVGSHSTHQYLQSLPAASSHVSLKKTPAYYLKGGFQLQNVDASGKSKPKKTTLHQPSIGHKKSMYPRVHRPYVKHKYPTRKTIHPLYRNYYQSPYQRYAVPSREMLRYKLKASAASPSPASIAQRHHTTERMDDAHPDGSSTAEDYSAYNDTHHGSNYYETYEEVEKTTSEPEESLYDENTTRGYYGDRIYMSTQVPVIASPDRAAVKNKFFIVHRTSGDEDIETIFE